MRKYITIILMCFAIFGKAQIGQKVETKKSTIVGKVWYDKHIKILSLLLEV